MSVLERIFQERRESLPKRMAEVPLTDVRRQADDADPPLGFTNSLTDSPHEVALIAEIKRASPSRGLIRANFNPPEHAEQYAQAGADCLSVLTERKHFQGDSAHLAECKRASGLPTLRKDFIASEYDVFESRAIGADAILLIVAMLDRSELADWVQLSRELGMDALVEVHDERECDEALRSEATLVGINNRNLHDMSEDLETTERLAPLLSNVEALVSESAIHSEADVERVSAAGARAVLVGTAFMAADDPGAAAKEVMGW